MFLKPLLCSGKRWQSMEKIALKVEEGVDGDLYIRLPDEVLEELGWSEDDTLEWSENDSGSFTLRKVNNDSSTEA